MNVSSLRASKRGFSLIELLVVIAVIGILAAMLLPAISGGKNKALQTKCLNNLRQISIAITAYTGDNQMRYPDAPSTIGIWWDYKHLVKEYLGIKGPSTNDPIFICPKDAGIWPPTYKAPESAYGSYVYNGVNSPGSAGMSVTGIQISQPSPALGIAGKRVTTVKVPTRTMLIGEYGVHGPWSRHVPKTGKEDGSTRTSDAKNIVGFADGHSALVKIYYNGSGGPWTYDPPANYEYQWSP